MFGNERISNMEVWVMIGICVIQIILGKSNNRTRAVQGTKNQYNITPTQTLFSPNFFSPKLRRLVVVLALALILQTRTLDTHEHRVLILVIHTSLLTRYRDHITPIYEWLVRKHTKLRTKISNAIRQLIPPTKFRRKQQRRKSTLGPTEHYQCYKPHKWVDEEHRFHPDPYLQHCFDQTKGYEGEGPTWQGDDLSTPNSQPDFFTAIAFLNADGVCIDEERDTNGGSGSLDTIASIKDILSWNVTCIGIGDAQKASENHTLRMLLTLGSNPTWPECRWIRSPLPKRRPGIPGGTCMGLAEPLAKRIIATYELHSSLGWFTGVMIHGKQIDGTPTKLAIITVYCPLPNRSGGAWTMMQNCLTANNNERDPAQQFYHELTELVCAAHKEGANVIVGGDFNTPFDVAHKYSKELEILMRT